MRSGGPRDLAPEVGACIDRVLAAAGLEGEARRDVLADLRAHFEDGLAAGRSAADLLERFGDPEAAGRRIREVWGRTGRERPRRRRMGWGRWMGEVRQAARTLRRSGAVSAMVVATLALGIGANTAVFTALDAVLLQDLPYPDADRLVRVYEREGDVGFNYLRGPVIQAYREWDDVFTDLGALYTYREVGGDLTGGDLPERVVVSSADAGLFATLGVPPLLGRTFRPEESLGSPDGFNAETGSAVAVLSHALWQRRFSGAADVIGRAIEIDGVRREIIGVMPQGFTNPVGSQPDVWVPQNLREGDRNSWGNYYLTSVARLQPGLTVEAARARLAAHADALARVRPEIGDWRPAILPLQEDLVGESRRTMLWVLAGAVALVLLSTCVNAGNLIFARALARSRELAVRGALGANRARLFVHLLLESALLAVGGGVAGLLLGWGALKGLLMLAPEALPALTRPTLSPRILLLGFAVTGVALLLSGLVPALRLSRTPPAEALRSGGRGGTESRRLRSVRSGLVITQLAVALALVVGAGLLVRSFASLRQVELGFQPEGVLTFEVHLPSTRYPEGADRVRFHRTLEQQVAALPGVHAVGATSWLPVNGRYNIWGLSTDPGDLENDDGWSQADVRIIAGDYFDAAGIRVLRGAQAADVDMEGASNVLWINETLAERLFPDEDPLGRLLFAANDERRIVGVVEDVAHTPRGAVAPQIFVPHAQHADDRNWPLTQVVRADGDLGALREQIRGTLARIDPALVLYRPRPLSGWLDASRAQDRFALALMGGFALLALLLSAIGTFGVLSGSVARRRKEIGIRMALGADRASVRRTVLASAAALTAGGAAAGLLVAWVGTRWLDAILFDVGRTDVTVFVGATGLIAGLALVAAWVPALRASRVDPARTLAEE